MAGPSGSSLRSLSIILPNYNGEKLIPRFFPSVLKAACNYDGDWEIIFVDDHSTDRSVQIIQEHMNAETRIRLVTAEANGGFSRSCNLGIKAATGEILFLLNTDVELAEDYFAYFNEHFDNPGTFAVTCCGYRYGTDDQIDGIKRAYWRQGFLRVTENIFDEYLPAASSPYQSFGVQG
ncbi:glycosyltransferase, partial [candidate division GN15 bacterium]|nr:glycosyltransferase [candidate division GN15 bacterium]